MSLFRSAWRAGAVSGALLLGVACSPSSPPSSSGSSGPIPTENHMSSSPLDATSKKCESEAEVRAALGTTCTVVGIYELHDVHNAKGGLLASWPAVQLAGGGRPVLIESVWDESKKPDSTTIDGLRGKRVAVTGMLNASPPGRIANMALPTLSPVHKLEVIGE